MSDELPMIDLAFIPRQQCTLLGDVTSLRDAAAMMAILRRVDGTMSGLVNEIRATHSQHSRLVGRVNAREGQQP